MYPREGPRQLSRHGSRYLQVPPPVEVGKVCLVEAEPTANITVRGTGQAVCGGRGRGRSSPRRHAALHNKYKIYVGMHTVRRMYMPGATRYAASVTSSTNTVPADSPWRMCVRLSCPAPWPRGSRKPGPAQGSNQFPRAGQSGQLAPVSSPLLLHVVCLFSVRRGTLAWADG